jgi:hypothetical protein
MPEASSDFPFFRGTSTSAVRISRFPSGRSRPKIGVMISDFCHDVSVKG